MQGANKRLVRNSESTLTLTSRSRPPAEPRERIAKHLSERALTAGGYHVGLRGERRFCRGPVVTHDLVNGRRRQRRRDERSEGLR